MFPTSGSISSTSKYTGSTRAAKLPNSPWVVKMVLPVRKLAWWVDIEALLAKLDGPSNWIRLYHPLKILPRGVACGFNRDNAAGTGLTTFSDSTIFSDGTQFVDRGTRTILARTHLRGENNVLIQGLVPSQELSIMTGDHMEIGGYLHMAVATVKSDASGKALVPIRPELRVDIVASSLLNYVEFERATSPFMMSTQDFSGFDVRPPDIGNAGLDFIEVLP